MKKLKKIRLGDFQVILMGFQGKAEAYKNQRSREAEQVSQARQSNEAEATARQQKQIELAETKRKLKEVFVYYAAFGDRMNSSHLKSHKFHKML